jgi:hypothetical protein
MGKSESLLDGYLAQQCFFSLAGKARLSSNIFNFKQFNLTFVV